MSSEQPKEHQIDGADLKAIEDFIYSTMNHTREWELAENAYQRILTVRSRPHTSTEEEICKRCLCTSPCQPWFDEHDATIRNATLDEIHARYVDAYLNPDNYNEINAKEVYQFIESLRSKGGEQ
jgi:hypothetical protein